MNFKKPALNFSNKKLTEFPIEVFKEKRLYKLNLSNNLIKEIPRDISQLRYLETLDLSGNKIRHLFSSLFELPNLKILILNNNQIINLPKQVSRLKKLKILNLANNKLTLLPWEASELEQLEELNLTGNRLDFLSGIGYKSLKKLWLAENPLNQFSSQTLLSDYPNLHSLYLFSAKLENPISKNDPVIHMASSIKGNSLDFVIKHGKDSKELIEQPLNTNTAKSITIPQVPVKIFISYSHLDDIYLTKLRRHLKVLVRGTDIDVWDDTRLRSSDIWEQEITKALNEATNVICLVSTDFLASDFIMDNELPPLLEAAREKGTKIHAVIVKPCDFEHTPFKDYQAANSPSQTLAELSEAEQERVFIRLINDIRYFARIGNDI